MTEPATIDLLPCPFCGGKPQWFRTEDEHSGDDNDRHGLECMDCGANVTGDRGTLMESRHLARERWNTRV